MDPFSITVGVIGIVQAVSACLKLSRKFVGPSEYGSTELNALVNSLYVFNGAMRTFQTHLEIFDDDDDHLETLNHLEPAIKRCSEALATVREFLKSSGFIGKTLLGARFDKKLKVALKALDEAKELFMFALHADQQSMIASVSRYLSNVGDDVHAIKAAIQDMQEVQDAQQPSQQYRDIKAWFGTHTLNNLNSQYHEANLEGREDGSGSWLQTDAAFAGWLTEPEDMRTLWLKGSHGTGKTFVCSQAIDHVMHLNDPPPVVLYYFFRFDDQAVTSSRTVAALADQLFVQVFRQNHELAGALSAFLETKPLNIPTMREAVGMLLRSLRGSRTDHATRTQLFLFLDGLDETISPTEAVRVVDFFRRFEADLMVDVRLWISCRDTNILRDVLQDCPTIDLDDKAESDVQAFLARSVPKFHDAPSGHHVVKVENLSLDSWVLQELQTRAKGNFLFAKLMVQRLCDGVFNTTDLVDTIRSSLPDSFAAMYRRTFELQYRQDPSRRRYARMLFAFVVFARRPLRLRELREAMTLALSAPTRRALDPDCEPMRLTRLFAPLIKMQRNPDDPDDPFCRLCHSTVREFLCAHPDVLSDEGEAEDGGADGDGDSDGRGVISERLLADICLRYLAQDRYGRLLQDPEAVMGMDVDVDSHARKYGRLLSWTDAQDHHLLTYAAKYWDKHMDSLQVTDVVGGNHRRLARDVLAFLISPNFQTLLQVQSLCVVGQFSQYTIHGRPPTDIYVKRVFPLWLETGTNAGITAVYQRTYRRFVNEWGYLLCCGSCRNDSCPYGCFQGEIDRCLTGLLGPGTFMSRMIERYPSFMLSQGPLDAKPTGSVFADGTGVLTRGGTVTAVVSFQPGENDETHEAVVETWSWGGAPRPTLVSSTSVSFTGDATAAENASFSTGIDVLRVGAHIFQRRSDNEYVLLQGLGTPEPASSLCDVTIRGRIVVVSQREKGPELKKQKNDKSAKKPQRKTSPVASEEHDSQASGSSTSSSSDSASDVLSSSSDSELQNSAEETFSEASADLESESSEEEEDDDEKNDKDGKDDKDGADSDSSDGSDDGDTSSSGSDSSRDEIVLNPGQALADYHDYQAWRSDDDVGYNNDDGCNSGSDDSDGGSGVPPQLRPRFPDTKRAKIRGACPHRASVAVYDSGSGSGSSLSSAERLFHYEQAIPVLLYHSPPALHPSQPLLVWPLCGGDVLFADYEDKTFFIRRSTATTRFTRHISMKVAFSPCGEFLHIASIEAQDVQKTGNGKKRNKEKKKKEKTRSKDGRGRVSENKEEGETETKGATLHKHLALALFATTHRLSTRKPTRCPPTLVHRVKVRLGPITSLSLDRLPFTFTWTPTHLYVSASDCALTVWRVALFRGQGSSASATVPQKKVMLPQSARSRPVQYLPCMGTNTDTGTDGRGLVLIGSYSTDTSRHTRLATEPWLHGVTPPVASRASEPYDSPPVGFYVDEARDLGGWASSRDGGGNGTAVAIRNGFRDGRLERKMEFFDKDNDCDLEEFVLS